jgi:hypothetical protein
MSHKEKLVHSGSWVTKAGILTAVALSGISYVWLHIPEGRDAHPLRSAYQVQTVIPEPASLPRDWRQTSGSKAAMCPPKNNCHSVFAEGKATWVRSTGDMASIEVTAFSSQGDAMDSYTHRERKSREGTPLTLTVIGDQSMASCQAETASSCRTMTAYARAGSVNVQARATGSDAPAVLARLLRATVDRAEQAQMGEQPNAAMY